MKICGIVIWYNPGLEEVQNIKTYITHIDKLIVVDNSSNNNEKLLQEFENIEYIANLDNLGIAKALNIGCKKSIKYGYKWVLTMDQDSNFTEEMILKFVKEFDVMRVKDADIAIFAPKSANNNEYGYVNRVITSGNILNIDAYKHVNGFDDNLFIDEVDHDMCYKLIKSGYKIYQFKDIKLNHRLGNNKQVKFITKYISIMNHNYIRKYYITRNRLKIKKIYPEYTKSYLKEDIKDMIKLVLFEEDKVRKLKYIIKGYKDYKNNKFGKLE